MPIINFQPSGKTIDVPAGIELLDAVRKADIEIESPCGSKGTCGKCIVRIVSGKIDSDSLGVLSESAVARGYALACKTKVLDAPVTVEIPEQISKDISQFIDETKDICLVRHELFPEKKQFNPLTHKIVLEVPKPRLEDGLSDLDRLTYSIQHKLDKKDVVYTLMPIRHVAEALRKDNGKVTVSVVKTAEHYYITGIEPGDRSTYNFGIALDIGTTTVAIQLVSLPSAKVVATRTAYNDQIDCGLDVISRINYARRPDRLEELRTRVLKTINHLLKQLCSGNEVDSKDICNAVIAGNTTMTHLLLGLKPEYIRIEPYTPTILEVPFLTAEEIGIEINPCSLVNISLGVGSYVGGDITAGLLCTNIAANTQEINLFIDIGTNGELVIGNRDFLVTCACSAGPAFEGGGIENGMRAAMGAIDIENIIRAKAAIYSACSLMLKQVGLGFDDLSNIYIAGGFGRFLDIEKAIIIGLLPDLPLEKYHYIGNSSLMGAYMVLVSQDYRQRQLELARRMTYMELSAEPAYMDQYTGALFLPHTDINRFPSVKMKKKEKLVNVYIE